MDPTLVTALAIILAAIQTLYAGLTYHRDRHVSVNATPARRPYRLSVLIGFAALTWAAVAADLYLRPAAENPQVVVANYGHQPPLTYFMDINARKLTKYSKDSKVMLLVRNRFADVDRITDKMIEKSAAYTISGDVISLALASTGRMRLAALQANMVEYDLVLLPSSLSPENVNTIGDLDRLGGKVLWTSAQTVLGGPPDASRTPAITGGVTPHQSAPGNLQSPPSMEQKTQ